MSEHPQFQIVQFQIPKTLYGALDVEAIAKEAKARNLERTRFEYSTVSTPPTLGRITTHRHLVPLIIDAINDVAKTARGRLLTDCGVAIASALKATGGTDGDGGASTV